MGYIFCVKKIISYTKLRETKGGLNVVKLNLLFSIVN